MLNILLYQELGKSRAKSNTVIKKNNIWDYRRMVKTQLLFAMLFLTITLPLSIAMVLYSRNRSHNRYLWLKFFNLISSIYFNSTIVILLIQNRRFRANFKTIILKRNEATKQVHAKINRRRNN